MRFAYVFFLLFPSFCACSILNSRVRQAHILSQSLPQASLLNNVKRYEQRRISDSCRGLLPWTCLCQPAIADESKGHDATRVDTIMCADADFGIDILTTLHTFSNVQWATFYGNNFTDLPDRFSGPGQHKKLLYLNLTQNRISRIHHDSFLGVPSLQSLDLSNNAIHLRLEHGDWSFLRPLRFLRRLLLRKAFKRHPGNENSQLHLLETGLRHAHLRDLQFLDISHNEFSQFPSKLICWTPAITHLILSHNRFRTLRFDEGCAVSDLKVIDLRSNRFVYFTFAFAKMSSKLPPMSVHVNGNPLDCTSKNCGSFHSMIWFRMASVFRDKERVRCFSSSEDDEREKFSDFMMYAPLDETLRCPPFGISGGPFTPKAKTPNGAVEDNFGNKQGPSEKQSVISIEASNLTVSANNTASIAVYTNTRRLHVGHIISVVLVTAIIAG